MRVGTDDWLVASRVGSAKDVRVGWTNNGHSFPHIVEPVRQTDRQTHRDMHISIGDVCIVVWHGGQSVFGHLAKASARRL